MTEIPPSSGVRLGPPQAARPMSDTELQPITVRPSLGDYLRDLRERREFMVYAPAAELRAVNFHTVLGNLWLLLNPALSILVYYVIFGLLLNADRGTTNYIGFLTVGVLVYGFLSSCVTGGSRAITANINLVRSVHFPRAVLPLSNTLRNFYEFLRASRSCCSLWYSRANRSSCDGFSFWWRSGLRS